jgi:hypothetical protein
MLLYFFIQTDKECTEAATDDPCHCSKQAEEQLCKMTID